MNRKAIIFGIKSLSLSKKEKILFKKYKPWGIILFSRNISNFKQVKNLTSEIRFLFNDNKYPILIDQEGGAVSRLNKIIDLTFFTQSYFGHLYEANKKDFFIRYKIYISIICDILTELGININTVPVLDVRKLKSHKVIGTRSFSTNYRVVSKLGKFCVNLYKNRKIGTVIKHIPGHGASNKDSHHHLPIINLNKKFLFKNDFKVFKKTNSLFAMTAHIIYSCIDNKNPATHSHFLINNIIRKNIGFKGILISDDISMKSLKYNLETNALRAIQSGCNLVLHCNANLKEMKKLAIVIPNIDKFTIKKTSDFYNFLS